jgi:hypothetical protein
LQLKITDGINASSPDLISGAVDKAVTARHLLTLAKTDKKAELFQVY